MPRYDDDDNDDSAFDENGLLKDGRRIRVPLMMRDSTSDVQRAVAEDAAARRFGLRHALDLHQPGPRFCTDAVANDAREQAYLDMVEDMQNAWRTPSASPAAARDATPARPTYDAIEGRRRKAEAYEQMVADMCDAWKGPAR